MIEASSFKSNLDTLVCLGALFCLLTLSGVRDSGLLMQYDVPIGIDGYYYVIQVNSFLESREFYYPTRTPVVLYIMSFLAWLTGNTVTAIKTASIFFHLALSLSLFVLMTAVTRSMWHGLLATTVSVASVTHLIWMGEFLKQLGGLTFFFWAAACLAQNPESKRRRLIATGLLVLALFCHKSIVFLVGVLLILTWLFHLLDQIRQSRPRLSLMTIGAVIFFCLCLPALAAAQHVVSLPRQISETVLAVPQFPIKRTVFEEKVALLFLAPIALGLCLRRDSFRLAQWKYYVVGITALFTVLVTLNPFLSHEEELMTISERLDLLAFLQVSVLLSGVAWILSSRTAALVLSLSAVALLLLGNNILPIGLQRSFVGSRKLLVDDLIKVRSRIPSNAIIIAPHGEQFLVTYATGVASQNSAVTSGGQERTPIWLLFDSPCRASETTTILSHRRNCSLLVTENFPLAVTAAEKTRIMAMNPHLKKARIEVVDRVLAVN
jgi:hypothetical protein